MSSAKTVFIAVLSALVVSVLVHLAFQSSAPRSESPQKKETVYDRVMRTGAVRCGYTVFEPGLKKDANSGEFSGIAYDLVNAMGAKLSLKVEWVEEAGFASMTDGLTSGRYDMLCSAHMITAARARVADYSTPVFYTPLLTFIRSDDTRFDQNPQVLNTDAVTYAAIDGTAAKQILETFYPKGKIFSLPELSPIPEVFVALATKKADATVAPAFEGLRYAEKNDNTIRVFGSPLFLMPQAFFFPRGETEFKAMMEGALEELRSNGTLAQIVKKYDEYPGSIYASRPANAPIIIQQ